MKKSKSLDSSPSTPSPSSSSSSSTTTHPHAPPTPHPHPPHLEQYAITNHISLRDTLVQSRCTVSRVATPVEEEEEMEKICTLPALALTTGSPQTLSCALSLLRSALPRNPSLRHLRQVCSSGSHKAHPRILLGLSSTLARLPPSFLPAIQESAQAEAPPDVVRVSLSPPRSKYRSPALDDALWEVSAVRLGAYSSPPPDSLSESDAAHLGSTCAALVEAVASGESGQRAWIYDRDAGAVLGSGPDPMGMARDVPGEPRLPSFLRWDSHPVMDALASVAREQSGHPAPPPESRKRKARVSDSAPPYTGYLCTGADAFVLGDPCTMCAMALLHARIARVIVLNPGSAGHACSTGPAPGVDEILHPYTRYSLHALHGLNHSYHVYVCNTTTTTDP